MRHIGPVESHFAKSSIADDWRPHPAEFKTTKALNSRFLQHPESGITCRHQQQTHFHYYIETTHKERRDVLYGRINTFEGVKKFEGHTFLFYRDIMY